MSPTNDRGHPTRSLSVLVDVLSRPYPRRIRVSFDNGNPRGRDEFAPEDITEDGTELEVLGLSIYHNYLAEVTESGYMDGAIEFLREDEELLAVSW